MMDVASARLAYRKFTETDFTEYLGLATSDAVMQYITGRALTEAEARTRFNRYLEINQLHQEAGFFAVSVRATGTFIGLAKFVYTTRVQAELGYSLLPDFWGQKYASEIVSDLLTYADQFPQLTQVIAIVDAANAVSARVLTKHAFVRNPDFRPDASVGYELSRPFSRL